MADNEFDDWRAWVTSRAHGRVLEVGAGDGVNFSYYDQEAQVIATEPDGESLDLVEPHSGNIQIAQASAEELPFPTASFDAVVGTLVFCTIPDAPRALLEVQRVLKRGGSLRLVEHVRARNPVLGTLMHALNPLWHQMTGGCNLNRDTLSRINEAGFEIIQVKKRWGGLMLGVDARKK